MKVSVPGMPVTLLNMSKNDIYKMVSGDKMDVKMNIFQRLWETLRHLFWSDKQTEATPQNTLLGLSTRMREKSLSIAWNYSINLKHAQKIRMSWSQRAICAGSPRPSGISS